MVLGVFVSLMLHGLGLKGQWLLERTTIMTLASVKLAIFCYRNNLHLAAGERATFHAKTRSIFLICTLLFLSFNGIRDRVNKLSLIGRRMVSYPNFYYFLSFNFCRTLIYYTYTITEEMIFYTKSSLNGFLLCYFVFLLITSWLFSIQVYSNLEGNRSHVVNTGWALMALIDAQQVRKRFR